MGDNTTFPNQVTVPYLLPLTKERGISEIFIFYWEKMCIYIYIQYIAGSLVFFFFLSLRPHTYLATPPYTPRMAQSLTDLTQPL